MCVPKSKSTFRHESLARTDEATKLILFTVTKSLPNPIPLILPVPDIILPSFGNLADRFCDVVECNCAATGNEDPAANT